ncbi:hypothetical protein [Streptomyces jumonjinensis]|uniref:hypothetical protein n=1 Tax=Streptomyces jumonjinensis TaxID=1945 RepID=UPI003788A916
MKQAASFEYGHVNEGCPELVNDHIWTPLSGGTLDDVLPQLSDRGTGGREVDAGKKTADLDSGQDGILEELAAYGRILASRRSLVHRANAKGVSELKIARLTGHSRTTIRKDLGRN